MSKTTKVLAVIGILLLGGVAATWFWFRSHTSDVHLNYIPKDAAAVFSIHNMEIASKINTDVLESMKPAQPKGNNIPEFLTTIMTDPMSTGIDPVQNFYGFVDKEKQSTVTAFVVAVNDRSDFTDFAKKMFPDREVESGNYSYISIDDHRGLAWNSEAALFISVAEADVRTCADKLFAMNSDESIKADTAFMSFNSKSFDAGLFTNNAKLAVLNAETSPLSLIGMNQGNSQFFLRFEQNEIVTEYVAPKGSGVSVLQAGGPPSADFTTMGQNNPLMLISFNLDMKNLLATAGSDPAMKMNIEMMTASLGMTPVEMQQLFTGSLVASVSDYRDIYTTDPRVQGEMNKLVGDVDTANPFSDMLTNAMSIEVPVTTISLGVTDEKKATDMLTGLGMTKLDAGFFAYPGIEMVIYALVKNNHLIITNDYLSADAITRNGTLPGQLPAEYAAKVSSQSLGLWMDFDKSHFPPLLMAPKNPMLAQEDLAAYVAISGLLTSVRYETTPTGSAFHFTMSESKDNSITRVIQYLQGGK